MTLTQDIIDPWRRLLGKKGEQVKLISDHSGVLIVQNEKGERFAVNRDMVIPSANTEGSVNKRRLDDHVTVKF